MAEAPKTKKTVRSKKWVEELIGGFDLTASPPKDEQKRHELVLKFAELDHALRDREIEPSARKQAGMFRRQFYTWFLKRPPGETRGWSLAEVEASPLLSDGEWKRWDELRGQGFQAHFLFNAMTRRASALFNLLSASGPTQLKGKTFSP
jgi:hypothetical protein